MNFYQLSLISLALAGMIASVITFSSHAVFNRLTKKSSKLGDFTIQKWASEFSNPKCFAFVSTATLAAILTLSALLNTAVDFHTPLTVRSSSQDAVQADDVILNVTTFSPHLKVAAEHSELASMADPSVSSASMRIKRGEETFILRLNDSESIQQVVSAINVEQTPVTTFEKLALGLQTGIELFKQTINFSDGPPYQLLPTADINGLSSFRAFIFYLPISLTLMTLWILGSLFFVSNTFVLISLAASRYGVVKGLTLAKPAPATLCTSLCLLGLIGLASGAVNEHRSKNTLKETAVVSISAAKTPPHPCPDNLMDCPKHFYIPDFATEIPALPNKENI